MASTDFNSEFHSLKRRTMGIATALLILTLPGVSGPTKLPLLGLDITGLTFNFMLAGLALWMVLDLIALWVEWKEQSSELMDPQRGDTASKLRLLILDLKAGVDQSAKAHLQLKGAGSFLQGLPGSATVEDFANQLLNGAAEQEIGGAPIGPQLLRTEESFRGLMVRVRQTDASFADASAEIAAAVVSDLRPIVLKALVTMPPHGTPLDRSVWRSANDEVARLVGANNRLLQNLAREAAGLSRRLGAASRHIKLRAAILPLGVPVILALTALAHYLGYMGYGEFRSLPDVLLDLNILRSG